MSPRKRIILHIGMHKTGSTALQVFLALNRGRLGRQGIFYPGRVAGGGAYTSTHRDLADAAVAQRRRRRAGAGGGVLSETPEGLLGEYARRFEQSGAAVAILSHERLSSAKLGAAELLASLGRDYDVTVIGFVRRPDLFLESMYRQQIDNQTKRAMPLFRDYAARQEQGPLYARSALFGEWAAQFGEDAVHVIPYEPAVPGFDVANAFFGAAELSDRLGGLGRWQLGRLNRGLSRTQAEFLRRVNLEGRRLSSLRLAVLRRFARDGGAYLGTESRRRIVEAAQEDLERLRRRYVRDGRACFFPAEPERVRQMPEDWDQRIDPALERQLRRLLLLPPPAA